MLWYILTFLAGFAAGAAWMFWERAKAFDVYAIEKLNNMRDEYILKQRGHYIP